MASTIHTGLALRWNSASKVYRKQSCADIVVVLGFSFPKPKLFAKLESRVTYVYEMICMYEKKTCSSKRNKEAYFKRQRLFSQSLITERPEIKDVWVCVLPADCQKHKMCVIYWEDCRLLCQNDSILINGCVLIILMGFFSFFLSAAAPDWWTRKYR